jgi:hypothetical protein
MLNKKSLFWVVMLPIFFIVYSCANRQPPGGGPRDHDPPKLLKATPPNMTRNFKAKVIRLDFDEYFKISNPYTEISMSPTPAKLPEYKRADKSIVITLKDSLEKNTTYVINFGKAIADVDEGNILKNFTYVFSTGEHIDSLSITGRVINTQTGEREKDATVMLFSLRQDSLLFGKKKPTIFTTTDTAGNFALNNLHPDVYRIYALKQVTANKIYSDRDLIAFNTRNIHLTHDTSNIQLRLFLATPEKTRVIEKKFFDLDGSIYFVFNRSLDHPSVKINYPPDFDQYKIVDFSKTNDTARIFMKNMDFDSLSVSFYENGKPIDTITKHKGRKEGFTRLMSFRYDLSQDNKLKPGRQFVFSANYPIQSFDQSLISIKEDSTDISNFNIVQDSIDSKKFRVQYRWKQNSNYTFSIAGDAFTDIYGGKNKATHRLFSVDKPENYSLLTLTVTVPDSGKSYIVELENDKKQMLKTDVVHKNTVLSYKDYITGKYIIKVIYDDNNNGKWDSGSVHLRRQPENIWIDPEIVTLRPNWEQQTTLKIPKESTIQ